MLFGGSGGQEFFERITWALGAIFIFGSLGLAVLKSKQTRESRLSQYAVQKKASSPKAAANQTPETTTANQ
jgi:preprotein translocase subunit SecG